MHDCVKRNLTVESTIALQWVYNTLVLQPTSANETSVSKYEGS